MSAGNLLARFGGEEFVAVLSDTDLAGAYDLAEQLRDDLARHPCTYQDPTIGIGVCAELPDSADSEQPLPPADQALYRAKAAGCVESYEASLFNEA